MKNIDDLIKHIQDVEDSQIKVGKGWWNTYNKTETIPIDPDFFPKENDEKGYFRIYTDKKGHEEYKNALNARYLAEIESMEAELLEKQKKLYEDRKSNEKDVQD